jgi:hypothetical protein
LDIKPLFVKSPSPTILAPIVRAKMGERVAFNLFPIIRVLVPLVGPDTIAKRLTTVLTILAALMVFAKLPATLIDVNATTALMDLIVNWMWTSARQIHAVTTVTVLIVTGLTSK